MYNSMEQMLYNEYGIQVQSLQQIPAGWSASAWKVHSGIVNNSSVKTRKEFSKPL